mmetsp:Transcript_8428/g.25321  ORF Transcript_8428/g.25321 Transcript_8428/m.25321 type:complete len:531 (+) Transcript_8428:73-1665(+)
MSMSRVLSVLLAAAAVLAVRHGASNAKQECKGRNRMEEELLRGAKKVLDGNWITDTNSTLPSPHLYPHQWSWDSAFIAYGYAHYNIDHAKEELRSLFRAQWRSGLVPHIVFNPHTSGDYFPGPKYWKTNTSPDAVHDPETSGIVQPAVHAIALQKIYQANGDKEFVREMYPKMLAWHDYLYRERDPHDESLVFVRHPWETGMDNAPSWDKAFQRIVLKEGDVPPYERKDNKHSDVDAKDRPTDFYYDRYVYLMKIFYDNAYNESKIATSCPYLIQDVLFNAILSKAEEVLADLADEIGEPSNVLRERSAKTQKAILDKLWNDDDAAFYDYDLFSDEAIKERIGGAMTGVYGAALPSTSLRSFLNVLDSARAKGRLGPQKGFPLPTMLIDEKSYMPNNYWRGPIWININYLIIEGLLEHGAESAKLTAKYLYDKTLELVHKSGFYEYFSALDASPHGGGEFSWTASLVIDMICDEERRALLDYSESYGVLPSVFISVVVGSVTYMAIALIRSHSGFGDDLKQRKYGSAHVE